MVKSANESTDSQNEPKLNDPVGVRWPANTTPGLGCEVAKAGNDLSGDFKVKNVQKGPGDYQKTF